MMQLGNCDRCGEVFAKGIRNICSKCYKEEEEAFEVVYAYLTNRKNRSASMEQIVEATEVEEALIIKFLREKRLRLSQFPQLSYPCEKCDIPITEGRFCVSCASAMQQALSLDRDSAKADEEKDEVKSVYYTLDRNKRK